MFDRIHHVAYTVDDLEAYRAFFGETLGLEEVDYRETDAGYDFAVYRVGETYVEVQEPAGNEALEAWLDEHGSGLNHVSFGVSDLEETLDVLGDRGVEPADGEPREAPTFPGRFLIDMDEATSAGIYLQITEEPRDAAAGPDSDSDSDSDPHPDSDG